MANDSIIIKKKKVVGHAAHHGGSWKVAYADFVTAMMAFFMVLWIMGLSDDTKASIQGYFNDPAGFMKNPPHSKQVIKMAGESMARPDKSRPQGNGTTQYVGKNDSEKDESKTVQLEVQQQLGFKEMDHVIVTDTTEGIQIEFLEDVTSVFFESGSAVMSPLGKKIIHNVVPVVKGTGRYLVLEGHTDRKPYAGKDYTNWELSTDRASAFRKQLASEGIPVDRFKEVRGYADTKLKFKDKPFAAGNRRVALLLPWGKKPAKADARMMANGRTKKEIGIKELPKFNIFGRQSREPHL